MTNSLDDYAKLFTQLGLTELSVEEEGFKLTLKKKLSATGCKKVSNDILENDPVSEKDKDVPEASGEPVKSPLLGIFYGEVNGRTLSVGDSVKQGDVLCSIEAMKMLNEVKAPLDGVIAKAYAKEGDLVEYDQVLFEIA